MHAHQRTAGRRRPTIAAAAPRGDVSVADPIIELQQTAGNQAVQRLLEDSTGLPTKEVEPATPGAPPGPPPGTASPLVSPRFAGDPALQACRQGQRLFQSGSEGESVVTLLRALIDLGYPMPEYGADGSFGGETHAGVVSYQRDAGLGTDGIIGTNTIGALDTDVAGVEPTGTEPPEVEPPGTEPPAVEPPGTEPPGTEPPAVEPPGTEPPPPGEFEHADLQTI